MKQSYGVTFVVAPLPSVSVIDDSAPMRHYCSIVGDELEPLLLLQPSSDTNATTNAHAAMAESVELVFNRRTRWS
jgi:hypothetical protein